MLTPAASIGPLLPSRLDFPALTELSLAWGVSLKSLPYRTRELGLLSEATARRGHQRIEQMKKLGLIVAEPVTHYPGETPCLLARAFALAQQQGPRTSSQTNSNGESHASANFSVKTTPAPSSPSSGRPNQQALPTLDDTGMTVFEHVWP